MLHDSLKLSGRVGIVLRDKDGNVIHEQNTNNLVVSDGLDYIASRMKDATATAMTDMAVGTGTTAANENDSALVSEAARVNLTSTTVTNNEIAYVASYSAGTGTGALTEAGIFNAASGGTMLCRVVFDVINKGADDSMTITWTVTLSAS